VETKKLPQAEKKRPGTTTKMGGGIRTQQGRDHPLTQGETLPCGRHHITNGLQEMEGAVSKKRKGKR